jgi:hypothetical protein
LPASAFFSWLSPHTGALEVGPPVNIVVTGFEQIGTSSQQRLQAPIRSDQYANNVTILRGRHQVKFGVEYRYSRNLDLYSPTAGGQFTFNNTATGSGLASLLLGWVQKATRQETYALNTRADSYSGFLQDDFRVTPKLTLNLGLRYDLDQPRWETKNRQNSFDRGILNPVAGVTGVVLFSGRNCVSKYANNWDWNNVGPRVGFAWKAAEKFVVRGGGAVLYAGEYDQATPVVANTGFSQNGSFVSPDNGVTPAFILSSGLPPVASPAEADLTPGFGAVKVGDKPTSAIEFFDPNRGKTGTSISSASTSSGNYPGIFWWTSAISRPSATTWPQRTRAASTRSPRICWDPAIRKRSVHSRSTAMCASLRRT